MSRTEFSHGVVKICQIFNTCTGVFVFSRSPISVAAAAIYMASQASADKKSQKGKNKYVDKTLKNCIIIYSPIKIFSSLIGIKVL